LEVANPSIEESVNSEVLIGRDTVIYKFLEALLKYIAQIETLPQIEEKKIIDKKQDKGSIIQYSEITVSFKHK